MRRWLDQNHGLRVKNDNHYIIYNNEEKKLKNLYFPLLYQGDLNSGSKILCAKFGTYTRSLIASGDDKNCVQIWQINN